MLRLSVIRHAEPDYAVDSITESGQREAQALAEHLANQGIDHLHCSTLGRARDTATHTAKQTGIEPVYFDELREFDWHTEVQDSGRLSAWDVPGEIIRAGDASDEQLHEQYVSPFNGELAAFHRFSDSYLCRFGYRREGNCYRLHNPRRQHIAVFCHGGVGLTWLAHLLALPLPIFWCGFWLAPCSITTIVFEQRSDHWAVPRCIGLGEVGHLREAGLQHSDSGFQGIGAL